MAPGAGSEPSHEEIVRHVAEVLTDKGFSDVRANLSGYEKPAGVAGADRKRYCVPDLTARGAKAMLIEVETAETLGGTGPRECWPLLSSLAEAKKAEFVVIVPESSEKAAVRKARELDVLAQVIGV
jgi:hypothetical protein